MQRRGDPLWADRKLGGTGAGAYQSAQAFESEQYVVGAVGAVFVAFGLAALGARAYAKPQAGSGQRGRGGLSQQEQLDFAQAEYDQRFGFPRPGENQFAGPGALAPRLGNLDHADPVFRERVERVLDRLERQGYQPRVASGVRTLREQIELVKAKLSPTLDSAHVWGFGADVIDRRWAWNIPESHQFWVDLGRPAHEVGLVWGGAWANHDVAHVELPGWRNLR